MKSLFNYIKPKSETAGAAIAPAGPHKSAGPSMRPGRTRPSGMSLPPLVTEPVGAEDDITFKLADFLPRIPKELLSPGPHDPSAQVRFKGSEIIESMERGRGTIPLVRVARLCPSVFKDVDTVPEDLDILIPWQKLLRQTINLHQLKMKAQAKMSAAAPSSEAPVKPPVSPAAESTAGPRAPEPETPRVISGPPVMASSPLAVLAAIAPAAASEKDVETPVSAAPEMEPKTEALPMLALVDKLIAESPAADAASPAADFRDLRLLTPPILLPAQSSHPADSAKVSTAAPAVAKQEVLTPAPEATSKPVAAAPKSPGEDVAAAEIAVLRAEREAALGELKAHQREHGAQIAVLLEERDAAARELAAAKQLLEEASNHSEPAPDAGAEEKRAQELAGLAAARDAAENALEEARKTSAATAAECATLRKQLSDAATVAAAGSEAEEAMGAMRKERDAAENALEEARKTSAATAAECATLRTQLSDAASVTAAGSEAEEAMGAMRKERDAAVADAEKARLEKRQQFDVFRTEFQSVVRQRAESMAEATDARASLAEALAQHADFDSTGTTAQAARASLEERVEKISRERDELVRQRDGARAAADRAAGKRMAKEHLALMKDRDDARQQLAVAVTTHTAEMEKLSGEIKNSAADKASAVSKATQKSRAECEALTRKHESAAEEAARLKVLLDEAREEIAALSKEIAVLNESGVIELTRERDAQRRKLAKMECELEAVTRERDELMTLPQIRPVHLSPPALRCTAA